MTAPQERPGAWRPKFGERVEGIYASQTNPQRVGMFVRRGVTPTGRMNAGPWWELTDGKGHFWRYPPESCRPAEPQERPVAGDGLDREAIERRARGASGKDRDWGYYWRGAYATDVPALLDALEAAEAEVAESVPRSALVQVGWWFDGPDGEREAVCVIRTEGGASW